MTAQQTAALAALKRDGKEAVVGKGGFFIQDDGFVPASTIYRRYGIRGSARQRRQSVGAWGEYATIAMLNGIKS